MFNILILIRICEPTQCKLNYGAASFHEKPVTNHQLRGHLM